MKYKKLLILLTIATLSLTACGKDSEPAEVPTETAVEETTEEEPESEDTVTNADRGTAVGDIIDNSSSENNEGDGTFENPFSDYTKNDESLEGYEVTITEVLDTQMYVTKATDTYRLDNEKAGKIGPVELGAYLTVTGKTSNGWYEVQCGYVKGYLPADVLSTENPIPQEDLSQVYGDDGRTAEEILEAFEKANSSGNLDDIIGEGAGDMEYTGNIAEQYDGITPW